MAKTKIPAMSEGEVATAKWIENTLEKMGGRPVRYERKWERRPQGYFYMIIQLEPELGEKE